MIVNGQSVRKRTDVLRFSAYTLVAMAGLVGTVRFAHGPWALHAISVIVSIAATVSSFRFRAYSHWFGILVVLVCAGSILEHLTRAS